MDELINYLEGGDLRSTAKAGLVLNLINSQSDFDKLFLFLFSSDSLVVMRAVDAIEKITLIQPQFLARHKEDIINFFLQKVRNLNGIWRYWPPDWT